MTTVALILVCIAVIVLAAPAWPGPYSLAAFVLGLAALLITVVPQVFK